MISNADRELVVAYLHHRGRHAERLTDREVEELFCLGDGYGSRSAEELAVINGGWDWSHVRDSSPAALAAIAQRLRTWGCGLEGRKPVPAA